MTNTTARITKNGKKFEILVDLEEALKIKKGEEGADITRTLQTDTIFTNIKAGDRASNDDLEVTFQTNNTEEIAEKIIKQGEVVLTTEHQNKEREQTHKQIIDKLTKIAVTPEGRPYTPERIKKALEETHIQIKNKPIEQQLPDIIEQLRKTLPIKIEQKKARITIPAQYTGKSYAHIKDYITKEEWQTNGNLQATIELPTAIMIDIYEQLNNITHGSILSEEIKE